MGIKISYVLLAAIIIMRMINLLNVHPMALKSPSNMKHKCNGLSRYYSLCVEYHDIDTALSSSFRKTTHSN